MSILNRLNRLVRSEVNDAFDRSNERRARSVLEEMQSSLREARQRQSELRRHEQDIVEEIREARGRADEWEERAMLALQHDDEGLAREALQVKNDAVRRADRLREELEDVRTHMRDIEASLEALEMKLESQTERLQGTSDESPRGRELPSGDHDRERQWERRLERRRRERHGDSREDERSSSRTSDRAGATESRREEHSRSSRQPPSDGRPRDQRAPDEEDFGTSETFREFDRMAGEVDQMEAEAEAMRELSDDLGDSRRSELEDTFRDLEQKAERRRDDETSSASSKQGGERERDEDGDDRHRTRERDDLSGLKDRVDRLSELKNTFSDDE